MRRATYAWIPLLAASMALAGCPAPATTKVPKATNPGNLVAGGGAGIVAAGGGNIVAQGAGNIVAQGAGNAVAGAGGNLVAAPAAAAKPAAESADKASVARVSGLVSGPAAIVASGAGNIVASGAGNRRLLALQQVPLAKAPVRLLHADGTPVVGVGGLPLTATTDANGRYVFAADPGQGNFQVEADLPADGGQLRGIALRPDPKLPATANVDVVTTMAASYVIERLAKTQANPQATLDKLDASLFTATLDATAKAFDAVVLAKGDKLTAAKAAAAMDEHKAADPALAAQLELVRKALIAAGQSDLGNGRKGTDVSVKAPRVLALDAGGALYVASLDYAVWRLRPDGIAEKAAGIGTQGTADIDGAQATSAALARAFGIGLDGRGRLLVYEEGGRLSRVEADGRLKVLIKGFEPNTWPGGLAVGADTAYAFTLDTASGDVTVTVVGPDDKPAVGHVFKGAELGYRLNDNVGLGVDAQGRIYLAGVRQGDTQQVRRLDPKTWAVELLVDAKRDGLEGVTVDPHGVLFEVQPTTRELDAVTPSGTRTKLMDRLPDALVLSYNQGAALGADGSAYLGRDGQVYRIATGQATVCMGATDVSPGSAYDLALEEPYGLAFGAAGELYVADRWKGHVVKIDANQVASSYVTVAMPRKLQLAPNGDLYVLPESSGGLQLVAKAGQTQTTPFNVAGHLVHDFVLQPDGSVVFLEIDQFNPGLVATLRKWAGAGEPATLATVTTGDAAMALARDPQTGAIYIGSEGLLRRWTPEGGLAEVKRDPWFSTANGTGLTCDATGRVVGPNRDSLYRYDPKADKFDVLAGPQGKLFKGTGVDDSLQWPAYPTFAPNGDLYVSDKGHKQVKSIPAGQL